MPHGAHQLGAQCRATRLQTSGSSSMQDANTQRRQHQTAPAWLAHSTASAPHASSATCTQLHQQHPTQQPYLAMLDNAKTGQPLQHLPHSLQPSHLLECARLVRVLVVICALVATIHLCWIDGQLAAARWAAVELLESATVRDMGVSRPSPVQGMVCAGYGSAASAASCLHQPSRNASASSSPQAQRQQGCKADCSSAQCHFLQLPCDAPAAVSVPSALHLRSPLSSA